MIEKKFFLNISLLNIGEDTLNFQIYFYY